MTSIKNQQWWKSQMKISALTIKNYKQFTNLELDLTYPKGHPKEGQPLDKICIIGQSGTGKTNLLEVIIDKMYKIDSEMIFCYENKSQDGRFYYRKVEANFDSERLSAIYEQNEILIDSLNYAKNWFNEGVSKIDEKLLIRDTISAIKDYNYKIEKIKREKRIQYLIEPRRGDDKNVIVYINKNAWSLLEEKIENFDTERLKYMDRLSNKLLNLDNYKKEDFQFEMQEWEANNKNILEIISDKLNTFLVKFNLELTKIDEYQRSYNDLLIKDLSNGNIIEYEYLSTGTKNLISTFIPLKIHNPKDSIILIDEPENSFYPDIQRKLTELYMEVGENNQLIFATHSPLIASSFEPWEVIELKFDKNNQVYREKYYEGENHVDNYTLDPRMLTWTGILTDIFDLKEDSNFSFREKKLMEYATLKAEIKVMKNTEAKEEAFERLQKIGKHLGLYNQK